MNKTLLKPEVQKFIKEFNDDLTILAFKGSPWQEISVQELIQQIEGFRKCKEKLPTWYNTENIYYPPKLHIEQTSSEITAKYKASLIEGESIGDITGGFGVDSYYFSEKITNVHYFEQNQDLSEITEYNFNKLGKNNISFFAEEGVNGIQNKKFDIIYVDPSRRHQTKGKVFFLKDCEPNLVKCRTYLLKRCHTLFIKTSPMLDISVGLSELKNVLEIHIVAINNEVKELLWLLTQSAPKDVLVKTINFKKEAQETFQFNFNSIDEANYSIPLVYLYEPNAAIMKSGGFSKICKSFKVHKLAQHSHLFTSNKLIAFPGRIFKIESVYPYQKSVLKEIANTKANISTRNFTETVAQLRKKWKIKDGGNTFLFFTTLVDGSKIVIKTSKMISSN